MDDSCFLRICTPKDIDRIMELQRDIFADLEDREILRENSREMLLSCLELPHFTLGMFNREQTLVALAVLYDGRGTDEDLSLGLVNHKVAVPANFKLVLVRKEYRGRGFQRILMGVLEKYAVSRGFTHFCTTVSPKNVHSKGNIQKTGYEYDHTQEKYGGVVRDVFVKNIADETAEYNRDVMLNELKKGIECMDFMSLREQYKEFIYKGFSYEVTEGMYQVTFSYEIPGLSEFETVWKFPDAGKEIDAVIFNRLLFELGMAEAISYWKVTCAPVLKVACGSLTEWQNRWWRKLFYNGLGEFMYVNSIEVAEEELLTIECESGTCEVEASESGGGAGNVRTEWSAGFAGKLTDIASYSGCLVPVGGGKDSVVSMEVLRNEDVTIYRINKDATVEHVLAAADREYKTCFVNRRLDPRILEMNKRGFLNGHIPFSAVVAFSTFISAYLKGIRYIALSNESSANESTVVGSFVNHQYSKSYEFERDFMEYIESFLDTEIRYFSLLRPLSELQIAYLFSKYTKYHKAFRSCNAGSKQGIWCCNCPKCLFVYIILSSFLTEETLVEIFGENLLAAEKCEKYFRELTGLDENKPFECVGTRSEVVMSLKKYLSKGGKALLPVKYADWLMAQPGDVDMALLEWNEVHNVPEELLKMLKDELR